MRADRFYDQILRLVEAFLTAPNRLSVLFPFPSTSCFTSCTIRLSADFEEIRGRPILSAAVHKLNAALMCVQVSFEVRSLLPGEHGEAGHIGFGTGRAGSCRSDLHRW